MPDNRRHRYAWAAVALLWVAYLTNYVDRQVVFSIFPVLRKELHFSETQLGLVGSVFIWVYSLCMPLTGRMADLFRRERVIIVSLVLWSGATLGTALSGSVASFLFWRGAMGVTESLYMPASLGLIAALHPGATRSRALALHATAQFMGIVAGGSYGGWAADHMGWRPGMAALSVWGLLYAAVLWMAAGRLPPLAPAARNAASTPAGIFRSRCFLAMCAAFFFLCVMLWMLYAWLPSYIYERFHLSMTQSGFTATAYLQASSAAGVLCGGWLGDAAGKRIAGGRFYVAAAGLLLSAPFAYLTLAAGSLAGLKAASAAFGLLAGLMMSNHFAATYDVTPERNYGFAAGILNMVGGLSGGAAILLAGLWKESVGTAAIMGWAAAGAVATALVMAATATAFFARDRARAAA